MVAAAVVSQLAFFFSMDEKKYCQISLRNRLPEEELEMVDAMSTCLELV